MLLELKTFQSGTFKQVIDALKDILMDVNFEFDENGLKIIAMNTSHVVLIQVNMDGEKFEHYYCKKKIYVGLNLLKLYTIIKTISNGDTLTLYIEDEEPNKLGVLIENPDKNIKSTFSLSMLDIDVLGIPEIPIDNLNTTTIKIQSTFFQKLVRDMYNIADNVEIRNINNQIEFKCKGDFCEQKTELEGDNNTIDIQNSEGQDREIIQGVFSLKYIQQFTKCTNLCQFVEINLKNEKPILLSYSIANIGVIKMALSQQETV